MLYYESEKSRDIVVESTGEDNPLTRSREVGNPLTRSTLYFKIKLIYGGFVNFAEERETYASVFAFSSRLHVQSVFQIQYRNVNTLCPF